MTKTVSLLCESFVPERSACANRAASIVSMLLKNGYYVNVFFLMPPGRNSEEYVIPQDFVNSEKLNIVPVFRDLYSKSNFLSRIYFEIKQSIELVKATYKYKSDVVIVSVPMLMLLPVSAFMYRNTYQFKILEVRDLIWRYFEFKKGLINRFLSFLMTKISLLSLSIFDAVVCVTHSQSKWIKDNSAIKPVVIENGLDKISLDALSNVQSSQVSIDSIIYAGSIGYPQNIFTLVDAISLLKKKGKTPIVTIVGSGPQFKDVDNYARFLGLDNIRVIKSVSFPELIKLYSEHNLLYGQLRDIPSLSTAVPTKIFEYLALSKPLIYGVKGEAKDILSQFEGVIVVEPDNPSKLAEAIEEHMHFSARINNTSLLSDKYTREVLIEQYLSLL